MSEFPVFIESDPDIVMAESKAMLEEYLGRELQPSDVEQLMLQFIVYREVLLTNRFNAGMASMLYQFSKAPILDYIAGLVAVERLPASSAGCKLRFNLVKGHGTVIIPEGTRVCTNDGSAIFAVTEDVTIRPSVNSVDVSAEAETAGKQANDYAIGKVNTILDPLAFVSDVSNIDITAGGSDVETDEQLRERIKLAPSQYSSAGARQSYLFYAKSANPLIIDVSVSSPIPGQVLIVPLTTEEVTPEQVIDNIYTTCNAENVRPLTDTVIVSPPQRLDYSIEVDIVLYENEDIASAKSAITKALNEYAESKRTKLGQDVILSHISQKSRLSSVYDVIIKEPAENIVVSEPEYAVCNDVIVNIIGFNHG